MKKVYKYATGQEIPEDAEYLYSCKNGIMERYQMRMYVWHYFLVNVE